jgi:tRNA-dihydrouridine synthase C
MKIILAPMEGVIDFAMREILTCLGGYDHAVTEFIRINDHLLPNKTFYKYAPELLHGGNTKSGTPVYIQLLGQHPNLMAENARRACDLGAPGIDLNFGCPAKTVNNHKGGSILLGYDDKSLAIENAKAIEEAGATFLAIHARTKQEAYRPPAHWNWIAKIKREINIPLVANGDIWSKIDAINCQKISDCQDIMIGRGGLALPNLANVIMHDDQPLSWKSACQLIIDYSKYDREMDVKNYLPSRIKQWFSYLKREYEEAEVLFQEIKTLRDIKDMQDIIYRNYL